MQGTATTKNPLIVIAARKRRYFFRVHICFHYTYLYTHIKERSSIAFLLYLVWTRQKQVDLIKYERKGPFFLFFIFIYLFFSFSELLFLFFSSIFQGRNDANSITFINILFDTFRTTSNYPRKPLLYALFALVGW